MMEKQIQILNEIKDIDNIIRGLEFEKNALPERLKSIEEQFQDRKTKYEAKLAEIQVLEKSRRKLEVDLAASEEKIKQTEAKLTAVKTNKEYQAGMKEIETIKKQNGSLEEEILVIMETLDQSHAFVKAEEESFKKMKQSYDAEKKELESRLQSLDTRLQEQFSKKEVVLPLLEKEVLQKYNRIKQYHIEPVITFSVRGQCEECNINIPPQLHNELIRKEKILTCPSCQRILLWKNQSE